MIRLNWKYLSFLSGILVLYFVLLYFMPQRFNWFVTLHQRDKNPFGAYVLKSLMRDSWIPEVTSSNKTLFELSELNEPNLMIICENFEVSPSGIEALMNLAYGGKRILISAHQMDTSFSQALKFSLNKLSFSFYLQNMWGGDTTGVSLSEARPDAGKVYWYPRQLLSQHFMDFDTAKFRVLARNTDGEAVALKIDHGEGAFILSSTPLVFSNFSMLRSENHEFAAGILSRLLPGALHWTEYYQLGRMESRTPLRYILTQPPLKWALYVLMISILMFMLFEMKRKQRVIPVLSPLKNETLDFVKTIARLYYQRKDHKNLAAKKILHFTEYLKHQLHVDLNDDISEVVTTVAAKTATDEKEVQLFFDQMNRIGNASFISSGDLKSLTDRIDRILKN
ncbi:MAG: hypothetical protein MI975_02420 [Cytophagales bacterium]|nr:hypothetical protein [Cytophagales bacterium]